MPSPTQTAALLVERIAELELAIEDAAGWERIGGGSDREFSRDGLGRLVRRARLMALKNPLIKRAVELQAGYVFGQGVSLAAAHPDVNAALQAFRDDPTNQAALLGHQALTQAETELQVAGNLFVAFFTAPASGRVRIRTIAFEEVVDVLLNPDDALDPWFYKRIWTTTRPDGRTETRTALYPDLEFWRRSSSLPAAIDGVTVERSVPVMHVKVGHLAGMRFGVPEVYAALDWAKAYKEFLEDWATLTRALSRYAYKITSPGGQAAVNAIASSLATTIGTDGVETNPPPLIGSVAVLGGGNEMEPFRIGGANVSMDDGRRLLLMVAAATGLPETFFGDVSVGALATAKSLDRPTELKFRNRQSLWTWVLQTIGEYVVEAAALASGSPLRGRVERDPDGRRMVILADDPETGEPIARTIEVQLPSILEHDVAAQIAAIVSAATLDGKALAGTLPRLQVSRLVMSALGLDDIDELLDQLDEEQGAAAGAADAAETMAEAARGLREALVRVAEAG